MGRLDANERGCFDERVETFPRHQPRDPNNKLCFFGESVPCGTRFALLVAEAGTVLCRPLDTARRLAVCDESIAQPLLVRIHHTK